MHPRVRLNLGIENVSQEAIDIIFGLTFSLGLQRAWMPRGCNHPTGTCLAGQQTQGEEVGMRVLRLGIQHVRRGTVLVRVMLRRIDSGYGMPEQVQGMVHIDDMA